MRRYVQILSIATFMMSLDGCSSNSMVDYEVDSSLPKIGRVEYTVGSSEELGFEWERPIWHKGSKMVYTLFWKLRPQRNLFSILPGGPV